MSCADPARLAGIATAIAAVLVGSVDATARSCAALAGRETIVTEVDGVCRVSGVPRPVAGSRIGYQLWLPLRAAWSGRMVMLGNGGYSSRLPLAAMTEQLARGAAVVATDTGHDGDDPDFARGRPQAIADWGWRVWAFADPAWSWWRFDFGHDLDRAGRTLSPVIDAVDPNLTRFRASGGKLLHYHGPADPVVSPLDSTQYHVAVTARMPTADWYRLFLAPGMGHCGGGPGFTRFDPQQAIEAWVEQGRAPDRLIARPTDPAANATRPLCPHPARAVQIGGDPARADSFACRRTTDTNQNIRPREKTA